MLTDEAIKLLRSLPLQEVMLHNGFTPALKVGDKYLKYRCPFHEESDPSFRVNLHPTAGHDCAGFFCYACGETNGSKGYGAIMLQQKLLERAGEDSSLPAAAKRLARDFNLVIEGEYYNGYFHRSKKVAPVDEIILNKKEGAFSAAELRALGCKITEITRPEIDDEGNRILQTATDGKGNFLFRHSWNPDYYNLSNKACPFDSQRLKDIFSLYPLSSYVSCKKVEGKDEQPSSREVSSTDSYPIFGFFYKDEKGWWVKKYEPYYKRMPQKNGMLGPDYKFTYWYEGNKPRPDLKTFVYGDRDVMNALMRGENEEVEQTDDTRAPLVATEVRVKRKNSSSVVTKHIFPRLIVCSGPRDAINTYFHSDAHVCWLHSESVDIDPSVMKRLFSIAKEVYIMFDIDKTGMDAMNRLAMRYVEARVIYLPEYLKNYTDPRTGRACKDAEQYFNFYRPREEDEKYHTSINSHFNSLIIDARKMRFWDVEYVRRQTEDGEKQQKRKYTINFVNLSQFLSASGLFKYIDEAGDTRFVYIQNNIVEIIPDSEIMTRAKEIMKRFLFVNSYYNNEELSNAISVQKKVDRSNLSEIRPVKLNFVSWGKDFDYFFFKNCAVRVSPEGIKCEHYADIPFHVNKDAILPHEFCPQHTPLFTITLNPEYEEMKKRYTEQLSDNKIPNKQKEDLTRDFITYERLWKYKLQRTKALEDMPAPFQFIYDTGRIFWRKEEQGMQLSTEEQQMQDMHFITKAGAIGYSLSRYRTDAMTVSTTFTDFVVEDERKSSGGTGKSSYRRFFEAVRKVRVIPGGNFITRPGEMGKNFSEFIDTVDSMVFIDDLRKDVDGEELKNLASIMTVRSLYRNPFTIPSERTPKIVLNMNGNFDLSNPAVYRRNYMAPVSDYYHPTNYSGTVLERSLMTKFGKDIIKEATPEEYQTIIHLMLEFCRFYLTVHEVIRPPISKAGAQRYLYSAIGEQFFIEWANGFFKQTWHYGTPIYYKEMIVDYLHQRGDDVTEQNVNKERSNFKQNLRTYCETMSISINPPVLFQPRRCNIPADQRTGYQDSQLVTDAGEGFVREKAWETIFINGRAAFNIPRRKSEGFLRCYYFYPSGQEPTDRRSVMGCPDADPDVDPDKEENYTES